MRISHISSLMTFIFYVCGKSVNLERHHKKNTKRPYLFLLKEISYIQNCVLLINRGRRMPAAIKSLLLQPEICTPRTILRNPVERSTNCKKHRVCFGQPRSDWGNPEVYNRL